MFTFSINPPTMPVPSAAATSTFAANPIPAPPSPPAGFFSTFSVDIAPPPPPPANQDPDPYPYPQVYPEGPIPVSYNFFETKYFC